jgi:Fe-S cluster biogenesis protein NfuA
MPEPQNLRQSGERIEQALTELQQSADARTVNLAEEVLRLVSELYGAGLARVLEIVRARAPELVDELASDELIASLLLVQGLHPDSLDARVEAALESVRPFLARHGGDVELLAIDDRVGAVKLRLLGSCDGCPSSAATLRGAVEVAITEKAPEVTTIVVEESASGGDDSGGNGDGGGADGAVPITLGVKPKPRYDECPTEVAEVSAR